MRCPTAVDRLQYLTDEDLQFLAMHEHIDRGVKLCEDCGAFGERRYCGDCGKRFGTQTWRECPNKDCQLSVTTDFCPGCGVLVAPQFLKDMEAGIVDWSAEAAFADNIVAKIRTARPDLWDGQLPTLSMVESINQGFGRNGER